MEEFVADMAHVTVANVHAGKDGLETTVNVQPKLILVSHLETMISAQDKESASVVSKTVSEICFTKLCNSSMKLRRMSLYWDKPWTIL